MEIFLKLFGPISGSKWTYLGSKIGIFGHIGPKKWRFFWETEMDDARSLGPILLIWIYFEMVGTFFRVQTDLFRVQTDLFRVQMDLFRVQQGHFWTHIAQKVENIMETL